MTRTAATVRRVCSAVLANPAYEMDSNGRTWCNYALNKILTDLGLPEFCRRGTDVLLANDIADKLENSCMDLTFGEAGSAAMRGELVVAAMKMPGHGHIALIYPMPISVVSGKWGRSDVPFCANVGKDNGVLPLNFAFGAKPRLWKLD